MIAYQTTYTVLAYLWERTITKGANKLIYTAAPIDWKSMPSRKW